MRRNTDPVGEVNSPLGWRKVLLSIGIDRPRYQKLSGLGLDQHQEVSQLSGSKLHGHVADDVSRSRKYHWGNVERVSSGGMSWRGKEGGSRGRWRTASRGQPCLVAALS